MPSIIKNGTEYSACPTSLNNLTNTNISSPVDGQVLRYNATNSKWGNSSVGKIEAIRIQGTTDSSGFMHTGLLSADYVFLGLQTCISHFAIPLNALSDGTILLQMRNSSFEVKSNAPFDFYAWFVHTT